jgi:hypothetical protein
MEWSQRLFSSNKAVYHVSRDAMRQRSCGMMKILFKDSSSTNVSLASATTTTTSYLSTGTATSGAKSHTF